MTADLAVLSRLEQDRLAELEEVIRKGLGTFMEVGRALAEVRNSRLYRAEHGTFEAYCQQQWNLSRSRAYRIIEAAEIGELLSPIGDTPIPSNEGQARELTGLPAATAAEVMRKARDDSDRVTAAAIRQAREDIAPKVDPWATRIAAESAAADSSYAEQAQQIAEPSPAVTDYLASSEKLRDSAYAREFLKALSRSDYLTFDAERLAELLNEDEAAAVYRQATSATRFADTLRRGRSGLRVIPGGK